LNSRRCEGKTVGGERRIPLIFPQNQIENLENKLHQCPVEKPADIQKIFTG
jgi:hypothetical protein